MIILDTDHLTEMQRDSSAGRALSVRLKRSQYPDIAITIINVEEQLRGRLAVIRRLKSAADEVRAYEELRKLIDFFSQWTILPFDASAARLFEALEPRIVRRIGPMDCKIASIVLTNGTLLLSRNRSDFVQLSGLRVEDWLSV
jgi:tRNA(fMet)-specific endonuclease VapC